MTPRGRGWCGEKSPLTAGTAHPGFGVPRRRKRCQRVHRAPHDRGAHRPGRDGGGRRFPRGTGGPAASRFRYSGTRSRSKRIVPMFEDAEDAHPESGHLRASSKRRTVRNRAPPAPRSDLPGPADGRPRPVATRRRTARVVVPEGPVARPRATAVGGKPSVEGNSSPRRGEAPSEPVCTPARREAQLSQDRAKIVSGVSAPGRPPGGFLAPPRACPAGPRVHRSRYSRR